MTDETVGQPPDAAPEPEFTPEPPPSSPPSPTAVSEVKQFGEADPKPNSVMLRVGKFFHLSWQSDTGTAVLAFIIFVILCILALGLVGLSFLSRDHAWLQPTLQIVVNAISAVAGAIVGASAASAKEDKK